MTAPDLDLQAAREACEAATPGVTVGDVFAWFTVLYRVPSTGHGARWAVRCACGAVRERDATRLRRGEARSCGCRQGARRTDRDSASVGPIEAQVSAVARALPSEPIIVRFERRWCPEPNTGCWLWERKLNTSGYGHMHADGREWPAHRLSWHLYCGPIPDGIHVLHRCDTRPCVNPAHLFLGTNADNVADRQAKGRTITGRGARNAHAKLTDATVRAIRARYVPRGASPGNARELSEEFGVNMSSIWSVANGKSWRHV